MNDRDFLWKGLKQPVRLTLEKQLEIQRRLLDEAQRDSEIAEHRRKQALSRIQQLRREIGE